MDSLFQKKEEWFTFYDRKGHTFDRKTEVRFDPLTGESSRIVEDPGIQFEAPDYTEIAQQTGGKNCPFCPENIDQLTPVFPKEIIDQGQITVGEATVVPNLFPYSKYNGVTVLSNQHNVRLQQFSTSMLTNAFKASQSFIRQVINNDKNQPQLFTSINWNYLPHSGGSIIHPHFHVVISESTTNYQDLLKRKLRAFEENHQKEYFSYLYEQEKSGDRWIGERGNIAWFHAFAPKSHHDYIAIFRNSTSIDHISTEDWQHFAEGLQAIFSTLHDAGLVSFNMILTETNDTSPVHARLIPRLTLGGLGTSDINFFQALHQEPLTYKIPEQTARIARDHFKTRQQNNVDS